MAVSGGEHGSAKALRENDAKTAKAMGKSGKTLPKKGVAGKKKGKKKAKKSAKMDKKY